MSGSGESESRENYSAVSFAREILKVADELPGKTVLIGHSFGGSMARIATYLAGQKLLTAKELGGLVLVDSMISGSKGSRTPVPVPKLKKHYYTDLSQGKRRFRLRPPQPCVNRYIIDYIAEHSLKLSKEGYEFKLDQAVFAKMTEDKSIDLPDAISMILSINQSELPLGLIYGENSRFFPADHVQNLANLFKSERLFRIEQAYHHVFLDQPTKFMAALQKCLMSFEQS